jgi:hypothetical protein
VWALLRMNEERIAEEVLNMKLKGNLYVLHPVVCHSKPYICNRQHNNSGKSNNKG